ncbi:phosphopyruvate hydratase [Candidatus Babeliales bacterium]|nr:phosphopyruvate hydratase [Candidatus Babeliales bacterium]
MKITRVIGKEIFDSRGFPTVLCQMYLEDDSFVSASVPSGMSRGEGEAFELRDCDPHRLDGKGVLKAIHNIDTIIGPALVGQEPDVMTIDTIIKELDDSPDKRKLGSNATLAASLAGCRAQAAVDQIELFECVAGLYGAQSVSLPFPLFNVISGGTHSGNNFPIQEIMIAPIGAPYFRNALEAAIETTTKLKEILEKKGYQTTLGDKGGFVSVFKDEKEPFDLIMEALEQAGQADLFNIAIDVAADKLYDPTAHLYAWNKGHKTQEQLLEFYDMLVKDYKLYSIEDGFATADKDGWKVLSRIYAGEIQIIGDNLFVGNIERIIEGLDQELANAVIIKPNQIGTLTETLQVIALCNQANVNPIISHRSGETSDTFIADLAVATSAGQIKTGGCNRSEHMAKYNRLLAIEDILTMSLLD